MTKSGYNVEETEIAEEIKSNSVSIEEQETVIIFMRDENFAKISTSDSTQKTRLDKLCKNSPEYYSLTEDNGRYKMYRVEDKTLISFRAKKKEISEEQRQAAGERMKKYQASRKS